MIKKIIPIFVVNIIISITITSIATSNDDFLNSHDLIFKTLIGSSSSLRQPAEFERMEGVLINYGGVNSFGIPYSIISEMSKEVEIVTIVDSLSQQKDVEILYQNNDIDLNQCSFLISPSNTYWTRDYGPWFIFNETSQEMEIVDFKYNRLRPHDNAIPSEYATYQNFTLNYMDLIHSGGNYMTDGQGISISTDLVETDNLDLTHIEIVEIVNNYLGVNTYHIVPDVNGDYIKHIDCWAKFLSPEVIIIREVPEIHSQYDEIETAVDYFEIQKNCYGKNYEIVRVFNPNNEPYINSLILNEKVFVPMKGTQWDDDAIVAYENAMPGYEIIGFSATEHSWESTDAIHCRIKGIPDREMLYIEHTPISGNNGYHIDAKIIPYSGESVKVVLLYWKIEGNEWDSIEMQNIDGYYTSTIPINEIGDTVYYYIHAEDNSGRLEKHPFIGAPGAHSFIVNNLPPDKPNIEGQKDGETGTLYEYMFSSIDPEGDDISYFIKWGDGNITNWSNYLDSGTPYYKNHEWTTQGIFTIEAKAKDTEGAESDWSNLEITMPKTKTYIKTPFIRFLARYPYLFPILQRLLRL
jgi:agmatine/peptidylarginine deiminase